MPASTSRPRFYPSLTQRSRVLLTAAGVAVLLPGCRRDDPIRYSTGYVKVDELVHKHPGWQDVQQLDAMIAHASGLSSTAGMGATATTLPSVPMPPPFQRRPLLPAAISAEKRRIDAVRSPAQTRVERLRNSANIRTERAVEARERELRATLDAELQQTESDLREESRRDRITVESKWYVPIRDLWLKEFGLETQVATYRPFPASPAYKISLDRLNEIRAQRQEAEQKLAAELEGIETRLTQRLADARGDVGARFDRQIADYRSELERGVAAEMRERVASMERLLGSLEPLERPRLPRAPEGRAVTLPSPAQTAAAQPGAAGAPIRTQEDIENLKAQRERLALYLERDVKRRLNRLATQHRWRLAFGPKPGLDDITNMASQLLVEEWTP